MHLLYADEAGHVSDSSQKHFVLCGVSVPEDKAWWLCQDLDRIAARFNPADPSAIELHGSPMVNGRGVWRSFPLQDRIKAIRDAIDLIKLPVRIFAVAVEKSAVSPRDPVEYAFEQLCSRFDMFLKRCYHRGDKQRGVIVFDKMSYESTLQGLATDFRSVGHKWGGLVNLAEVPLFLDSRASRLVQSADLIAYGTFRNFERGDPQFFDLILQRVDSEGGTKHGLHYWREKPA